MRSKEDADWDNVGSEITPLGYEELKATEHLEYESKAEMGKPKSSACEIDDLLPAAKYIGIEGAPGLTQSEEKDVKMAEKTGVAKKKSKMLPSASKRDGLDTKKVRKYSAARKKGVRGPEAGKMIEKRLLRNLM